MKNIIRKPLSLALIAFALATIGLGAHAQAQDWPTKPIRVVIPYAPGGVGDTVFRIISPVLEARLGQRFFIDNRTGAAGNIGTAEVAHAKPDGYTLLVAPTANFAVNQHLFSNMGFDVLKDLEPIALLAEAPLIAVTSLSAPGTLKDFVSQARSNPRKYNFGSPGVGSPTHLAGVSFSQLAGNSMVHIAYRGTPPLVLAMMSDEVQLAFPTITAVGSQIKAGKLKAIAVMGKDRLPELPGVPTVAEAGFPDMIFGNWWAMAAPTGTDPKIIARLSAEVRTALADPAIKARLAEVGHVAMNMTPTESTAFVRAESARYQTLIERNGIKLEK
jgi:tripartite-type tricarboxylate transporter receptor subunit TctC